MQTFIIAHKIVTYIHAEDADDADRKADAAAEIIYDQLEAVEGLIHTAHDDHTIQMLVEVTGVQDVTDEIAGGTHWRPAS